MKIRFIIILQLSTTHLLNISKIFSIFIIIGRHHEQYHQLLSYFLILDHRYFHNIHYNHRNGYIFGSIANKDNVQYCRVCMIIINLPEEEYDLSFTQYYLFGECSAEREKRYLSGRACLMHVTRAFDQHHIWSNDHLSVVNEL